MIEKPKADIPEFGLKDGMIVRTNWTTEDLRDFASDFLNVNYKRVNDSTKEVANAHMDILLAQGVGRINAELMAAGIEWYLDRFARKHL